MTVTTLQASALILLLDYFIAGFRPTCCPLILAECFEPGLYCCLALLWFWFGQPICLTMVTGKKGLKTGFRDFICLLFISDGLAHDLFFDCPFALSFARSFACSCRLLFRSYLVSYVRTFVRSLVIFMTNARCYIFSKLSAARCAVWSHHQGGDIKISLKHSV